MTKRVALVTGCEGMVGRHLCKALSIAGWEVVGVDCIESSQSLDHFFQADVRNLVPGILPKKPDIIFHLACNGAQSAWTKDPLNVLDSCYTGTLNVLRIAAQLSSRVIYLSSIYVDSNIAHDDKRYPYIAGKAAAEALCLIHQAFLPVTVVRVNNIYGDYAHGDSRVVPTFIEAVKSGQTPNVAEDTTRQFVFVSDVVEFVLGILEWPFAPFYQLEGEEIRISNLAKLITEKVRLRTSLKEGLEKII